MCASDERECLADGECVCVYVCVACADDKTQWIIFTAVYFFLFSVQSFSFDVNDTEFGFQMGMRN